MEGHIVWVNIAWNLFLLLLQRKLPSTPTQCVNTPHRRKNNEDSRTGDNEFIREHQQQE